MRFVPRFRSWYMEQMHLEFQREASGAQRDARQQGDSMAPKTQAPPKTEHAPGGKPLTGGSWRPWKIDEVVVGTFLRLRQGDKGYVVDLILDDGANVTASAPKMLADALDTVKEGTKVSIIYRGKKTAKKSGKEYGVFDAQEYEA